MLAAPLPRFQLIPFEMIAPRSLASYLVKGIVPREGLIIVWGPPKCGKSFWCFDISMHVALGIEYRGRRVRQGGVVYIAAEGASGQGARIEAWRKARMTENIDHVPFHLLPDRLDLIADGALLVSDIRAQVGTKTPALVVIDTLNRTFAGSESSDEDMTAYIRAADAIKDAFGCAIMVVHHCGIESTRPRGHTSLTGAADAQIAVKRDPAGLVVSVVEWLKDGQEGAQTTSRLEVVEVGIDEDGEPVTSCVITASDEAPVAKGKRSPKLAPSIQVALDAVRAAIADAGTEPPTSNHVPTSVKVVPIELWRKYAYQRGIAESPEARQKAFKRAVDTLSAKGLVGTFDGSVWVVDLFQS